MRRILIFLGTGALLLSSYFIVLKISRVGEVKLLVRVVPGDTILSVNEAPVKAGVMYLSPGKYTFKASKQGWKDDVQKVTLKSDGPHDIGLTPIPNSVEASKFLTANPDIQLEREKIGGENFNKNAQAFSEENPITQLLPYIKSSGPFRIDYGPSKTRKGGVIIIISDSTANGRVNALKWIRQQGFDPTDYEIVYSDFVSPLGQGSSAL